jgi:hypothetical protein
MTNICGRKRGQRERGKKERERTEQEKEREWKEFHRQAISFNSYKVSATSVSPKEGLSRPRHIGHPIRTTQGGQEAAEHMGTKFFVFVFFCF